LIIKIRKKRYRADVLVEDHAEKINQKAQKEIEKARARFGDAFNEEEFVTTNARVVEYLSKYKEILSRLAKGMTDDLQDVKALIEELEIADPETGSRNWTDVKQFNLMFGTKLRSFCRFCNGFIFTSGNSAGYFCELPECTEIRSYENSFWNCSNR
jgi:glycyl-tRNA synthetase